MTPGAPVGHFSRDVGEMKGRSAVAETMDGAGPVSEVAAELAELEHAKADPEQRHIAHGERWLLPRPWSIIGPRGAAAAASTQGGRDGALERA